MSGYCNCTCRDCFEIAISGDDENESPLCHDCKKAGCTGEIESECQRDDAYGVDSEEDANA